MEIENIQKTLEEYGLGNKESKVYLATLMLGQVKVNEISRKANLLRETTYAVLKSLVERGLASYVIKSGVKYFQAASPDKLIEILNEKKKRVENILSNLKELQKSAVERPRIELYEGPEGMKTASSDIVKKKDHLVLTYINSDILKVTPFYHPSFRLKRKQNKVFMNVIAEQSETITELKKLDHKELRKTKTYDNLLKGLKSGLYIYEDKILFLKGSDKEQFGIIIQDKELAELQKRIFNEIWKQAKP